MSIQDQAISGKITLESKTEAICDAVKVILDGLHEAHYSQDEVFAVHLAVEEAFVNAVKHGNKLDSSKKVIIEYSVTPKMVEICVTDEGKGFNPAAVPDPRVGDNLFKADGRGILLIRSYMDIIEFNETGNRTRMVKYKV